MKQLITILSFVPLVTLAQPSSGPYPFPSLRANSLTYYVAPSPLGNDSNNGLSPSYPFLSVEAAERVATNGCSIHLMDGTNQIGATTGSVFPTSTTIQLANGVNWYSEPNAWIILTNSLGGCDTTRALFYCAGNNIINNLNLLVPETNNSETCIGYGQSDSVLGHTNIIFNNLNLITFGTGIHIENGTAGTTNLVDMTFNNAKILANACAIMVRGWHNASVKFLGGDVTLLNFTNVFVCNSKPLRAIALEQTIGTLTNSTLTVIGTAFHISDQELSDSNRPVHWIWNQVTSVSNVASLVSCSIQWLSNTNPGSMDLSNAIAGNVNVFGCYRTDGTNLTYATGLAPNFGSLNGNFTAPLNVQGSITFTNGAICPTNYVASNFSPIAGNVKIVASNSWFWAVTATTTNRWFQFGP